MHFPTMLAALASAAASLQVTVMFEYYPTGVDSCEDGALSATFVSDDGSCHQLGNPASSFHIGGPANQDQVPEGCAITGYNDTNCEGSIGLSVDGPSDAGACYISGTFMGYRSQVQSVKMECEAC